MIFAYMGDGEPPALPEWECLTAAPEHRFVVRSYERCNYLQGLEGDIDPYHLSYLHLAMQREVQARGSNEAPHYEFFRRGIPRMEIEYTDYGVRIFGMRDMDGQSYLRISNYVCPNMAVVAGGAVGDGYMMLWHVPIDDASHFKYRLGYRRSGPAPKYDDEMQWTPGVGNKTERPGEPLETGPRPDEGPMVRGARERLRPARQLGDRGDGADLRPQPGAPRPRRQGDHRRARSLLAAIDPMPGNAPAFRIADERAMRDKLTEIVVAALIGLTRTNTKRCSTSTHAARKLATKSAAE